MTKREINRLFTIMESSPHLLNISICMSIDRLYDHNHWAMFGIRKAFKYIYDHKYRSQYYWGVSSDDRLNGFYLLREYILSEELYKDWK